MRWERLFADLEAQLEDLELSERDALVTELQDGEWAAVSWRDLLGGHVVLEVLGLGRLEGEVRLVTEAVIHLTSAGTDHVVAATSVLAVLAAERRAEPAGPATSRLGWGHVLRAAREEGDLLRLVRADGAVLEGAVTVVGRDFVRMRTEGGAERTVPLAVLAAVSFRS